MSSKKSYKEVKKLKVKISTISKKKQKNAAKLPRQTSDQVFKEICRLTKKDVDNENDLKVGSTVKSTISKDDIKESSSVISSTSNSELDYDKHRSNVPVPIQSIEDRRIKPTNRIDDLLIKKIKQKLKASKSALGPKTRKVISKPKKEHKLVKIIEPKFIDQSIANSQKSICRICFSSQCTAKTGELIIPCNCRGIFSTVHQKCISDWIVSMCSEICDVCRFKFLIKTRHKGVFDFIKEEHQLIFLWRFIVVISMAVYLILISSSFVEFSEYYSVLSDKFILIHKTSSSLLVFILLVYVGYHLTERALTYRKWRKFKYHISVKSNPNYKITELITPPLDAIRSSGLGQHSIKPLIRPVL